MLKVTTSKIPMPTPAEGRLIAHFCWCAQAVVARGMIARWIRAMCECTTALEARPARATSVGRGTHCRCTRAMWALCLCARRVRGVRFGRNASTHIACPAFASCGHACVGRCRWFAMRTGSSHTHRVFALREYECSATNITAPASTVPNFICTFCGPCGALSARHSCAIRILASCKAEQAATSKATPALA